MCTRASSARACARVGSPAANASTGTTSTAANAAAAAKRLMPPSLGCRWRGDQRPRRAVDLQHEPRREEAQQPRRPERPAVAAEPRPNCTGGPRRGGGAEHVRAEDPAEDHADALAAE